MSHQGSGSEHEDIDLSKTGYHAGFPRQGVPPQYQATDIVHPATSETPHHPSRPPNFLQPWRLEHRSGQVVLERTYTATPERNRDPSMGNKSASSVNSDKGSAPVGNTHAAKDKDERTIVDTKRGLTEVARGSHDGAESRVANVSHPVVLPHSSDWLRHNVSHTQTQPPTSVAVPLVTPAALADMGHLYKLPTSATPSQPKIYSSGIFNPLYTLTSTTALQYSSYVSPSTVTYSPYISGYPVTYPVVAQGSVGSGPYTTVESYSAMLASMGSQVQQAQGAQVPISTYLPSGVIPLPYGSQLTHGITNLSLLPKSSGQDSVPTVGYLNQQQLQTAPGVLPSGQVFTGIVPIGGSLLTLPPRSEAESNRPEPSQEKEQEHNQSANLRIVKREEDERNMQREPEALPFLRQTYSIQPDNPQNRSTPKAAPVVSAPTVDYKDRHAYHETSTRHESIIMTVTIPSDKSRQTGAKDTNPVYASGEHQQWSGASYNQPTDDQDAVSYHQSAPSSSVQHSPQVRFQLSPSPHARPSSTVSHIPSSDSQDVELVPMPSDPRTYSVAVSADHRPAQTQEVMVHTSALEPDRTPMHNLMAAPQISAPSFSNIPSYFTRGSVIQLASGELKRVEDMRTEDFVHSADMCGGLKIDSSTVVRINEHVDNGVALISFLVGEHKAQVSLEAPMEHPFFVFGQGWSAVKPGRSLKSYNLGCHKLAVGDVCVSLTVKDKHGRWPPQTQQLEEPLVQHQPPPQQKQSQKQSPQQIPVQAVFSGSSKEIHVSPSWPLEPKRPRLEPVQEDSSDWRGGTDPRPDMTWQHESPRQHESLRQRESPQHRSHPEPPPSSYTFAVPPPVSRSFMPAEQNPAKFMQGTDSNANTVLIRTTDTLAGGKGDRPTPRSDKPLQPLKRRWSDPMHMAQLAADQERHANTTKATDPH
ncbi:ataxin-1-like [Asterias rubens]|uniref:ataxin-1-like n=1 Tax=Asterias rubens TaxID=7604 RepID=UPI001455131D|nr:ataxin-1-like [Asterias rubens]